MPKVKPRLKITGPRHHVREWRKYRDLTLEQLAERIGVTHGALSQLERGLTNYTQPMLEALANELRCTPGELINVNPTADKAIWSIWEQADQAQREQIEDLAETVVRGRRSA